MPLPGCVFCRRHRRAAVDTHHHADRIRVGADGKARRGVVGLVIPRPAGVVAQRDHRGRHGGVHRDCQCRRGRGVAGVVRHLHREGVLPVRQRRRGEAPGAVHQRRRVSGPVNHHLHADGVRIHVTEGKRRRGVVRDVVRRTAAAVAGVCQVHRRDGQRGVHRKGHRI